MLQLFNHVTLDVIAKVLYSLFFSFLCSSPGPSFLMNVKKGSSNHGLTILVHMNVCFLDNSQVAFGVDLDLLKNGSTLPKAIEKCLKGTEYNIRDYFFEV